MSAASGPSAMALPRVRERERALFDAGPAEAELTLTCEACGVDAMLKTTFCGLRTLLNARRSFTFLSLPPPPLPFVQVHSTTLQSCHSPPPSMLTLIRPLRFRGPPGQRSDGGQAQSTTPDLYQGHLLRMTTSQSPTGRIMVLHRRRRRSKSGCPRWISSS